MTVAREAIKRILVWLFIFVCWAPPFSLRQQKQGELVVVLTSALDQFLSADIAWFIGEPSVGANVLLTNGRFCVGAVGQRRSRKLDDVLSGGEICP